MARGPVICPEYGECQATAIAWVALGLVVIMIACGGGEPGQKPTATPDLGGGD